MSSASSDPQVTDPPRAAALIADPDNIGWPLVLTYGLAVLVDQFIGLGARWGEAITATRIVDILTGLVATLLLLWLAKAIYLRRAFPRRHVSVMVVTMFVSVLVGTLLGQGLAAALTPPDSPEVPPTGLDQTVFGTGLLVIVAWGVGSLRAFRAAAADLRAVEQRLTVALDASERAIHAERDEVITPIASSLQQLVDDIPHLSPADASLRIRTTVADLVRPVSHELIAATTPVELPEPGRLPRPSWAQTLSQVAASPLMLPKIMAIAMTLLLARLSTFETSTLPPPPSGPDVSVTVDWVSLVRALAQLAVVFLAVWLSATVASKLLRRLLPTRTPVQRWIIVLASVPAVALVAQVIVLLAFSFPELSPVTQSALRNPVLFVAPLALIATATGLIRTAQTRRADILKELKDTNTELAFTVARLNEQLWTQRRSMSKHLHGSVQGALHSAALLIERTPAQSIIRDSHPDVMDRLDRAIALVESATPSHLDIARELTLIEQTWQGICTIDVDVEPGTLARIQADPLCAAPFVDIVGEATANAVIHGGAHTIVFHISEQGARELRIEAIDDGRGVVDRDGGGLGSQLLREACTAWGLASDAHSTRLFAVIPLRADAVSDAGIRGVQVKSSQPPADGADWRADVAPRGTRRAKP